MYLWKRRKNSRVTRGLCLILLAAAVSGAFVLVRSHAEPTAFEYHADGRRDPFVPLVGVVVTRGGARGVGDILSIEDVSLQGILVGPDGAKMVIINGEMIKEGDKIGTVTIESIGNNAVKIKIEDEVHEIHLYEQPQ
jgi:cysteine synthase